MTKTFEADYRRHVERQRSHWYEQVKRLPSVSLAENGVANICHIAEANLRYFFPNWGRARCHQVIGDILLLQSMAHAEQSAVPLMDCTILSDRARALVLEPPRQPRIFCTYHTGSYRQFYLYLKKAGIDFLLLMSGKTMVQQGEWILRDSQAVSEREGWGGAIAIVDAESQSGLLQAMRALRRGLSVLVYIDGNSGVGGNAASDNLWPVDFLGRQLMARTGVATLSHLTGAPIVPVIATRDVANLHLTLHEAIEPGEMAREAYVSATTQALYDVLGAVLAQDPGQWEGWLYLQKFLGREAGEGGGQPVAGDMVGLPRQPLRADLEQFAMLYFSTQAVLLNKAHHRFTMLDAGTAAAFRAIAAGQVSDWESLSVQAGVQRLIELGALQPA